MPHIPPPIVYRDFTDYPFSRVWQERSRRRSLRKVAAVGRRMARTLDNKILKIIGGRYKRHRKLRNIK